MEREPNMADAVQRAIEAGQSLIIGRLALVASETRQLIRESGSLLFVAVVVLTGWLFLVHGVIGGFARHYPRFAVEVVVGLVHLALGMLFVVRSRVR